MTDIIFYSFEFVPLLHMRRYVSLNITLSYNAYGTFEAHFSKESASLCSLLNENKRLFISYDGKFFVLTGFRIEEDLAVFARSCEWLLTKRAAAVQSYDEVTAEEYVQKIAQSAAGDILSLGTSTKLGTKGSYKNAEIRPAYDIITETLGEDSLGFSLVPNLETKKLVFSVYKGKELTTIVSESARTAASVIINAQYQSAVSGSGWYKQKMTSKGNWNPGTNTPALSARYSGNAFTYYHITGDTYTRFNMNCEAGKYLYSDTPDGQWKISSAPPEGIWRYIEGTKSGLYKWDTVITGETNEADAKAQINKLTDTEEYEATARRLTYGTDYSLGDVLSVQTSLGSYRKTARRRVSSIEIYRDTDGSGIRPVLTD